MAFDDSLIFNFAIFLLVNKYLTSLMLVIVCFEIPPAAVIGHVGGSTLIAPMKAMTCRRRRED